jgi:3-hydroxyisobutyrate dehydrogenase-like beta-hydroxyacid dehydrogenase
MNLAVIGLGRMGHALAHRLLTRGHQVQVWNRSPGKEDDLVGLGATRATDPAQAVAAAEATFVSLTDDQAVRAVLLPAGKPLTGPEPSSPLVDCSTVSLAATGELAASYGDRFVAAPILGGPSAVAAGEATYLAGGPSATVDGLGRAFGALTSDLRRTGEDATTATRLKLLSNFLLMSGLAAMAEVVVTAQALGMSADELTRTLDQSAMVPAGIKNRIAPMVDDDHRGWFTTAMGAKDVALFGQMAADARVSTPLAAAVEDRFRTAVLAGQGEADLTAVVVPLRAFRHEST